VTSSALITLAILAVAIVLLLSDRLRADLIALLILVALGVTHVISPSEIFSGFSRSAVITIMALFILTNSLYRTGVTHWLGDRLSRLGGRQPARLILVVMLSGAMLSWFMNTIAAGAVLAILSTWRQKYDLTELHELQQKIELEEAEVPEVAPEADEVVCLSCGTAYSSRLPVCPNCKHMSGQ